MTNEQASRVNSITAATDKMKQNIRDRYHFFINATPDEILEHCVFIEGVISGSELTRNELVKTQNSLRSAIQQLGELREQLTNMSKKKK